MPLSSYLRSGDFGSHPAGGNKVGNLKHSNEGGVLRFWRALWLCYVCWQLLLGEGVTASPCSGKWLTVFHRSEAKIPGAHVHCRATLLPATSLTLGHHPHRKNLHDPVLQSSLLMMRGFEAETTSLRIKTRTLPRKCLLLVLINSTSSSVARHWHRRWSSGLCWQGNTVAR